ncbi:DUF2207 domain-containing protein [Bacteroides sp. 519]|uniref:DUF2207 domain-containing protein n=1 Tax=Bacteroides sp. 519 TaxID=2302937 RepID=UPI0013D709B8|nr:DUF2207 domain-containing protein [Bacteroides sp. 519]NDV59340.1 DUF2207 domain-containing protein [Bacteroides sp. 519]
MYKKTVVYIIICILNITSLASKEDDVQQRAEISDYDVDVIIHKDGKITVTESIVVYADGWDIKKGIVRSLPLFRQTASGENVKVPTKILNIMRDGNKEDFHIVKENERLDIFIGDSDRLLEERWHKYDIVYETYGQIGFFDDYDELYWNVTGNDWIFKIHKVTARIQTPQNATVISANGYTGKYGEKGSDYTIEENNGIALFQTTGQLRNKEGFTIAVAFTPHIINRAMADKQSKKEIGYLLKDIGKVALIVMIVFCVLAIVYYSKKEKKLNKFYLDEGILPGTMRYFYSGKFDKEGIIASLLNMVIKGYVKLTKEGEKTYLEKTTSNTSTLSWDEQYIYNHIFLNRDFKIQLSNSLLSQIGALKKQLDKVSPFYWSKKMRLMGALMHLMLVVFYVLSVVQTFDSTSTYFKILALIVILFDLSMILHLLFNKIGDFFCVLTAISFIIAIQWNSAQSESYYLDNYSSSFMLKLSLVLMAYVYILYWKSKNNRSILKERGDWFKRDLKSKINFAKTESDEDLPYAIAMEVNKHWIRRYGYTNYREFMRMTIYEEYSKEEQYTLLDGSSESPSSSSNDDESDYSSGSYSWNSGSSSERDYSESSDSSSSSDGYSGGGGGGGGGHGW